ncbi:MAG: ABC transporter ATP-binding protein [Candidatus Dormibacteria bacterium]
MDLSERRAAAISANLSPAINTQDLWKRYRSTTAVAGLTMTVPRGQVFGFLGPNGAGKTTSVKMLLGLARPTSGEAWVLGRRVGDLAGRRRIGYLPELFRYQGWLTGREVLRYHCRLAGIPRPYWAAEAQRALDVAGLPLRGDERVSSYSKGMQQRLGLGVALLGKPELVVLDEPTSALDPVGRHDVRAIIRSLAANGTTVFLNSHLLDEVEQVCDRVAILDRGRVIATGDVRELLAGEGGVRLRVTGLTPTDRAALTRFGPLSDEDGWLVVAGVARDAIPEIVSATVRLGGRVHGVEALRRTLEDRFLALLDRG